MRDYRGRVQLELTDLEQLAVDVLSRMTPARLASVRARGYVNIEPYCGQVVPVSITPEMVEVLASRKDAKAQRTGE